MSGGFYQPSAGDLYRPRRYADAESAGFRPAYRALVAAMNPSLWLELEETTGTSVANSGSTGGAGTLNGGATFATAGIAAPSGAAGLKRGIDFSAASADDIAITSTAQLGGGSATGAWTVGLVLAGSASQCYLASRAVNNSAIIYNYVADKVEFLASGMTGADPRPGSQITLSSADLTTPHLIVYRYNNGTWSGLLDGVEVFSVPRSFAFAAGTNIRLGSSGAGNYAPNKFWDFFVCDSAISTADLLAAWNARNIT